MATTSFCMSSNAGMCGPESGVVMASVIDVAMPRAASANEAGPVDAALAIGRSA
jgi:hypothetical protein